MSRTIGSHLIAVLFPAVALLSGTDQAQAQCRGGQQSGSRQLTTTTSQRQPPGLTSQLQQQQLTQLQLTSLTSQQLSRLQQQTAQELLFILRWCLV